MCQQARWLSRASDNSCVPLAHSPPPGTLHECLRLLGLPGPSLLHSSWHTLGAYALSFVCVLLFPSFPPLPPSLLFAVYIHFLVLRETHTSLLCAWHLQRVHCLRSFFRSVLSGIFRPSFLTRQAPGRFHDLRLHFTSQTNMSLQYNAFCHAHTRGLDRQGKVGLLGCR